MPKPLPIVVASLCAALVHTQVSPGDLAMVTFSTDSFGIATPPAAVGYTTSGFGGSGAATSQAILHDPSQPNDFLIGGFGFIGRATITGPGTVSYALLTTAVGIVSQMTWDANGNLVFVDSGTDQVRMLTATNTVVDLSTGAQPWGTTANCGAYDPLTGDVIVGNDGGLYRLASGATTGTTIVTGLGGSVTAVQFDRCTGDILAPVLTSNRLVRVDAAGTVTDIAPAGSLPGGNALAIDKNGDLLVGVSFGEVRRLTVDGTSTLYATNPVSILPITGLAYVEGPGYASPFGTPCAGPLGLPWLRADGDYAIGGTVTTTSVNHLPNAIGVVVFALQQLTPPIDLGPVLGANGCLLYADLEFVAAALTDANGELTFAFTTNAAYAGQRLYAQHAVLEGPSLADFRTSNALCLQF